MNIREMSIFVGTTSMSMLTEHGQSTCSGTTAFVAEKWGRRWITRDTSRMSVTLAKQRLMTSSYDYYELKYPQPA